MFSSLQRAFASNLQKVVVKPSERTQLEAAGINDPTLQTYFAWRRGLLIFVVISTILSAALTTYRGLSEDEEEFSDVIELLVETAEEHAPAAAPLVKSHLESEEDEEEPEEAAASETPAATPDATVPPKTILSRFDDLVHLIALYLLPVAAIITIVLWRSFHLTFRIMVGAFAFSFVVPILLSFCPWSWWDGTPATPAGPLTLTQQVERITDGLIEGFAYMTMLLPTVLSLLPGVQRACVRVKTLLPQSVLPGWMLVSASPFYALFLLVICVVINQLFDSPLIVIGLLLVMSSSLYYGIRWDVFTRPLVSPADFNRLNAAKRVAGLLTAAGGTLILIYLTTHSLLGHRLLGLDPETSLVIPLDLVEFFLETIGRSMFMTAFVADLFLLMNLSAWKSAQPYQNSPAARQYDQTMQALDHTA